MTVLVISTVGAWLIALGLLAGAIRSPGLWRKLQQGVAAVLFAALAALLTSTLILLRSSEAFSSETLVARVTARRLSPNEFELTYAPAGGGEAAARRVRLQGNQWAISGSLVKWSPWLTALGVKSYHKPMRLTGQFSSLALQRAHRPTVYALAPEADRFWECFYWADRYLPFVDAVYGSSAYVYVEPKVEQDVYVTPSGYLIKRRRPF